MSQQETSRAAVDRLLAELAATDDMAHGEATFSQIKMHAELADISPEELAEAVKKLGPTTTPVKPAKAAKPAAEG